MIFSTKRKPQKMEIAKGLFAAWTYSDGKIVRAIQVWFPKDHGDCCVLNVKNDIWTCEGTEDGCLQNPQMCRHAQVLNNMKPFFKRKYLLFQSNCLFCDCKFNTLRKPKKYDDKGDLINEERIDIVFLSCGHYYHKDCFDGDCIQCEDI